MNAPRSPGCSSGEVFAGTQACATHAACSSGNVMSASANAGPVRVSDAATAAVTAIDLTCVPPSVLMDVQQRAGLGSRVAHGGSSGAHETRVGTSGPGCGGAGRGASTDGARGPGPPAAATRGAAGARQRGGLARSIDRRVVGGVAATVRTGQPAQPRVRLAQGPVR